MSFRAHVHVNAVLMREVCVSPWVQLAIQLCVDDEPRILQGLPASLNTRRMDLAMLFATGASSDRVDTGVPLRRSRYGSSGYQGRQETPDTNCQAYTTGSNCSQSYP